ncbi:flagellar biosynthetic protein FliR [Celeribacter arenosi]|uniref:Flagellar biosynthetic protein FliR n=1 Tax=Celeribacter arenosi TaxID=792649 RepID=A0ABP7JXX8_9RHOB
MTDSVALLLSLGLSWIGVAFLIFVRVGAAMAVLPAFGEKSIPQRIRLVLTIAFTMIVFPSVAGDLKSLDLVPAAMGGAIFPEVIAGLVFGLAFRLFVMTLQMAGVMIAQSTSLSQIFGGGVVEAQPAIGHILSVAGLALAVMLGLHVRLAELLIVSYTLFPFGEFVSAQDLLTWGTSHVGATFSLAFTLAAPFVIGSLIYNVALGVINRAMPQLMVAFVGAPAITLGGLILLFACAPVLLEVWQGEFAKLLVNPFGGMR